MINTLPHARLLEPTEHGYNEVEQLLRIAARLLIEESQAPVNNNYCGLDETDKKSPFFTSLAQKKEPWTSNQLTTIASIMRRKYTAKLNNRGLSLPEHTLVEALAQERVKPTTTTFVAQDQTTIDVRNNRLYIHTPYNPPADRMELAKAREFLEREYHIKATYNKVAFEWCFPLNETTFNYISKVFLPGTAQYSEAAQSYYNEITEKAVEALVIKENLTSEQLKIQQELLATINVEGEVATGVKLRQHQVEAVKLFCLKHRAICGDDPGLGKTFQAITAAMAWQRARGYKVYIISNKSAMEMWRRTAIMFEIEAEVYCWHHLKDMNFAPEQWVEEFVLIVDEAHNAQSMESLRTKAFLQWSELSTCKACYMLTGTPQANGRPIDELPLLFAAHHPMAWSTNPARLKKLHNAYERQFCGAHRKKIGKDKYTWDVKGASNLLEFNRLTQYQAGRKDNHRDACVLSRRKIDCVDLPEKTRILQPVELSNKAEKLLADSVKQMWENYESNIELKIQKFTEEYKAEHKNVAPPQEEIIKIRQRAKKAEAVVALNFFRHAGALAKMETSLEYAEAILQTNNKLVVFTNFVDVGEQFGALVEKTTKKKVGYILGEVSEKKRNATIDDFQREDGDIQVVVCTAAGGESITLTAATYMLILDRPWRPGDVSQWENRIHRLSTILPVIVYWMQLPEATCDVDVNIDNLLIEKQKNIDMAQYGLETQGLQFASHKSIEDQADTIVRQIYDRFTAKNKGKKA